MTRLPISSLRRQAFARKSPSLISDFLKYVDFISEETEHLHRWGTPCSGECSEVDDSMAKMRISELNAVILLN